MVRAFVLALAGAVGAAQAPPLGLPDPASSGAARLVADDSRAALVGMWSGKPAGAASVEVEAPKGGSLGFRCPFQGHSASAMPSQS